MPIRMEEDPNYKEDRDDKKPVQPGGGINLIKWLPLLLLFIFKKPKLLIPILIIGGIWYFFFGGGSQLFNGTETVTDEDFTFGATLSEEQYDKAEVFEPLAYGYSGYNSLPKKVSLLNNAPERQHQGRQGSCVGWASAFAARTILESQASGKDPNSLAFSPAYLYNQIALPGCQGAYMLDAMEAMKQNGAVPFRSFPYDQRTCTNEPGSNVIELGKQFRIKGYNRLTKRDDEYSPDIMAVKQHLSQKAPVVIGMQVGGTFMSRMVSQEVWRPTNFDYSMNGYSGHAMCVIGYDDDVDGGSFQIMNSWGPEWGNDGTAFVRYRDFEYFVKEAYGLYPMGASPNMDQNKLEVEFGILDVDKQATLALKKTSDITFQTVQPVRKADKFKILVANSIECYIYVFGQESDGSSYVLFPYTTKHSPYCGITGTRLFPKDYNMTPDEVGNKDFMAIVVSKKEINFTEFNSKINASRQKTYAAKLTEAMGSNRVQNITFQTGNTVAFSADTKTQNMVGMVMEMDKR